MMISNLQTEFAGPPGHRAATRNQKGWRLGPAGKPPTGALPRQAIRRILMILTGGGLELDIVVPSRELGWGQADRRLPRHLEFILDHCGNASVQTKDLSGWKADIGRLAERKNVVCKVSGIVGFGRAGPLDGRRPRADRQPRIGSVRPRSRRLRRRLAGLHTGRDLSPVGRGIRGLRLTWGPGKLWRWCCRCIEPP